MKCPLTLSLILALVLSGCASQRLSLRKDGPQLAPVLGTKHSEIRLLSNCVYIQVEEDATKVSLKTKGIIALTKKDLYILSEKPNGTEPRIIQKIPLSDIEGVAEQATHLQIKHRDETIIVRTYKWWRDTLDQDQSTQLFKLLIDQNVQEFAADNSFGLDYAYGSASPPHLRRRAFDSPDLSNSEGLKPSNGGSYQSQNGNISPSGVYPASGNGTQSTPPIN